MEELELKFQELITNLDLDVIDVEYVKDGSYNYLRVYIEAKDRQTTLDDCETVSNIIGDEADRNIKEKFILEVSTPGIERKLKKIKDYIRFSGNKVELRTKNNVYDKKIFVGILKGVEADNVLIDDYVIPFEKIKQTKLVFDFKNYEREDKK